LGFYSGLPGVVRSAHLFSLCVVSLLSSRLTARTLVWFSNFIKYLVFHSLNSPSTVHLQILMDHVVVYVPRCVQNASDSLGLKALEDFVVGIGGCPLLLNFTGPYGFKQIINLYYTYTAILLWMDRSDVGTVKFFRRGRCQLNAHWVISSIYQRVRIIPAYTLGKQNLRTPS
jgi:hypothetical protein